MRVTEHAAWNPVSDRGPRLAVIFRFVDERIAIVHLVKIDGDVSGAGFVTRRFDVADRSPRWQARNVLRDVGPILTTVTRQLHQSVVSAHPDQSLLFRRLGDRKDD